MQDLCSGAIGLDTFRGVAFVGGFSYADVLGSAKGRRCASARSLPRTLPHLQAHRHLQGCRGSLLPDQELVSHLRSARDGEYIRSGLDASSRPRAD